MNKIILIIVFLISVNMLLGSDLKDESSMGSISIREVNGDGMPGWEKQIIELYSDEEGHVMPVIFRGAAKHWEAAAWTPEYFAERFGDAEIVVIPQRLLEDGVEYDKKGNLKPIMPIQMTMKDHIKDIILNPKNACYFFGHLGYNSTLAKLQKDESEKDEARTEEVEEDDEVGKDEDDTDEELIKNSIFVLMQLDLESQTRFPQSVAKGDPDEGRSYIIFVGSGNTVASLHSHGSTFLSQMYGKKLATLVAPKYIEKCSCQWEDGSKFVSHCAIDIMKPDLKKYPELRDVEVHQTVLEAGDVLYIPEGWLHDIRGLSTSISIASGF